MAENQKNSSRQTQSAKKRTKKTSPPTREEALVILASAIKICHEADLEVGMTGDPYAVIFLPQVTVTDGKMVMK